jgi:restriction system protein
MARRNQGLFDDLVAITSKFPWWVGVILAIIAYLVLQPFATTKVAPTSNPKELGAFVSGQIYRTAAIIAQYLLPAALLIGAAVSALGRRKRNALHVKVAAAGAQSTLEKMSWREFEMLVGEHFRRRGYSVEETGGGGADGGVDLVISSGTESYLVQCKQWKARQVGVQTIRELYGVIIARGADGGYVVTSGVFTDEARRFADGRGIELIAGDRLVEMIRGAQTAVPEEKSSAALKAPSCPKCGSRMVKITARKGPQPGRSFWGCSKFPNCRGTRPVESHP